MAIRKATSSGNWDGGATHPFDALPVDGDTIHTNGFTVTITGHINLPAATLTNAAGTGISAGGSFSLSGSWNITVSAMTASTVQLLYISGTTTNTFTGITCTGGSGIYSRCINTGGIQTLTFNSCTFNGGSGAGAVGLLFQGVVTDVTFSSCFCACGVSNVAYGVSSTTGAVTCTGSLSILQLSTSTGEAISCGNSSATWTLSGSVTHRGSAVSVYLTAGTMTYTVTSESITGAIVSVNSGYWSVAGSAVLTVTRASGIFDLGNAGPALIANSGANSRVTYTGDVICGNSVYGHAAYHSVGGGTGFIKMYGTIYGPSDVTVLTGARCAAGASVTVQHLARNPTNNTPPKMVGSVLRWTDSTNLTRTASGDLLLVPSSSVGDPPSQTNVRNGTSYHFGTMTGTLIVPSPSYVSTGVATDNTVGTLVAGMTALELRQALFHADDTANKLRVSDTGGVELNTEYLFDDGFGRKAVNANVTHYQGTLQGNGDLPAKLDAIRTNTNIDIPASINDLPTNVELATALDSADDAVLLAVAGVKADTGIILPAQNTSIYNRIGAPAGASISADLASVKVDTGTTIPGLFTTLTTKIKKFFQLSLRKDAAIATDNAAELTELNASGGSGVGSYLSTTYSQEAIRDSIAGVISSAIASAGVATTVTGIPTFLRVGDARTVANGGAIAVRLYDADDDDSLLFGLGTKLFADATITFSLRRGGNDGTEGTEDAVIPCTWVASGGDGYVRIAYEGDALDGCDAMDKLKEKDCHRWGIKFQWGDDDPITPVYGTVSVLRKIVSTQ